MPLDVAEIIRAQIPQLRDFTSGGTYLDRAFECQSVARDWRARRVRVKLFGSTASIRPRPPQSAVTALADGFYSSVGTALGSVSGVTITGGVLTAAPSGDITGGDLNTADAVLYYLGDLTIASGVDLKIAENIELRVRGALTVNGKISGKGRGYAGVTDTGGTVGLQGQAAASSTAGTAGFIGATQGSDGLRALDEARIATSAATTRTPHHSRLPRARRARAHGGGSGRKPPHGHTRRPAWHFRRARRPTLGLPAGLLRGPRRHGRAGGAGLVIICRGLFFGASGEIDLSGDDGSAPTLQDPLNSVSGVQGYPGAGGAGIPAPAASSSTATTSRCPT